MKSEDLFSIDKRISKNRDEVIISLGAFSDLDDIHKFDMLLFDNIPEDVGCHYGHLINIKDTDRRFFTFGRNAEELFKLMKPILEPFDFLQKAEADLRFNNEDGNFSELEFKLCEI